MAQFQMNYYSRSKASKSALFHQDGGHIQLRGLHSGIQINFRYDAKSDTDEFELRLETGSANGSSLRMMLGTITLNEDSAPTFIPSPALTEQIANAIKESLCVPDTA